MASGGLPNGVPVIHRHGAHDSALDVEPNGVTGMRLRELEEENTLLAEKATAAGTWLRNNLQTPGRNAMLCYATTAARSKGYGDALQGGESSSTTSSS